MRNHLSGRFNGLTINYTPSSVRKLYEFATSWCVIVVVRVKISPHKSLHCFYSGSSVSKILSSRPSTPVPIEVHHDFTQPSPQQQHEGLTSSEKQVGLIKPRSAEVLFRVRSAFTPS